ncbi:MAG: hypothetical protein PHG69_03595 [Candidatus Omnitrophica bacterium]|nr:hypothetical protein [Candidatus Omnitrophota bacterium]
MFILPTGNVLAQHYGDGYGSHGGRSHGGHGNWDWGYHHPRGYHWYNGYWWLGDAIVAGLVIGATLSSLPPNYKTVYVKGARYYYDGVYYYQPAPLGYVVVADPTTTPLKVVPSTQPQTESSGIITINVPNSKGGYTPVRLTKYKDGYLGPQGEYYPGSPTVEQLKALYGQ